MAEALDDVGNEGLDIRQANNQMDDDEEDVFVSERSSSGEEENDFESDDENSSSGDGGSVDTSSHVTFASLEERESAGHLLEDGAAAASSRSVPSEVANKSLEDLARLLIEPLRQGAITSDESLAQHIELTSKIVTEYPDICMEEDMLNRTPLHLAAISYY